MTINQKNSKALTLKTTTGLARGVDVCFIRHQRLASDCGSDYEISYACHQVICYDGDHHARAATALTGTLTKGIVAWGMLGRELRHERRITQWGGSEPTNPLAPTLNKTNFDES